MSIRSCSDAELAFELALRSKLSSLTSEVRSFDDFLDGSCCSGNDGVHPAWDDISSDVFNVLDSAAASLRQIRKGVFESASGEYSGPSYD